MKYIKPSILLISTLMLFACGQPSIEKQIAENEAELKKFKAKVEQVEDEELQNSFRQQGGIYFMLANIVIENQKPPTKIDYTEDPFKRINTDSKPDEVFENFLNGFYVQNSPEYPPGHIDMSPAFNLPFEHQISWKEVYFEDDSSMKVSYEFRAEPPVIAAYNGGNRLRVELNEDVPIPKPTRITGSIAASIPSKIDRISFKKKGQSRTVGDYKIKLAELKGHISEFEITRKDGAKVDLNVDSLIIGAKDRTGRYLDQSGSGTGKPEDFELYYQLVNDQLDMAIEDPKSIKNLEEELDDKLSKYEEEKSKKIYKQVYFDGRIKNLEMAVFTNIKKVERALDMEPVNFDAPRDYDQPIRLFPTKAVVISNTKVDQNEKSDLNSEEIFKQLDIEDLDITYGAHTFDFEYPEVKSDRFIGSFDRFFVDRDALDWQFYSADGNKIVFEDEEKPYRHSVNRLEFSPEKFPAIPVRVIGSVNINTAPDMQYEWVTVDNLPKGLIVQDNMVIQTGDYIRDTNSVLAFNAQEQPLKKFASIRYPGRDNPLQDVDYYYGHPEKLLIISKGETVVVPYKFDISFDIDSVSDEN